MAAEINPSSNVAVVLLAAGDSSRLGHPKQLLSFKGRSLLQHSMDAGRGSDAQHMIVVLGSQAAMIESETGKVDAMVIINEDWQEGLSSSIRAGIQACQEAYPDIESVILMVCDQPFVSSALLNNLIRTHHVSGKAIVASGYANTVGTPALFHKDLFPYLMELRGDAGAKKVIRNHEDKVAVVSFPKGTVDVDTETDYEQLSGEQ